MFILIHPANFPCGRKPEQPEKTHEFRQSVDRLFSHEFLARIEPTISEVKVACSATAPPKPLEVLASGGSWASISVVIELRG
jgi:hypothetical protein